MVSLVLGVLLYNFQLQSKQRYDSGESGVFSNSSSCPCGCGKEYSGCVGGGASSGSGAETDTPTSLYIPSSYITNKLSQVVASSTTSPLTCVTVKMDTTEEMPLDMSKTSSIFQNKKDAATASSSFTIHQQNPASHRDLFPGLYLLVDTALGVHDRMRPVHVAPMKG